MCLCIFGGLWQGRRVCGASLAFLDDNISTVMSIMGLGRIVVIVDDVRCPDLILSSSWTRTFLCAQRTAGVDRSGWSRHVRRCGAWAVTLSVDPLEGTMGNVIPPAHTFTRATKAISV